MNYLELLNAFYERIQCSRVSNNGQLLYHTLLMINNKSSWSDWFSRTNVSISSLMNVSEKAFMNARAELKQIGLIDFVSSKKRGECTKYRILYPTNYSTKAGTNDGTKETQTTVQSADIDKLKQKLKQKSSAIALPEKCTHFSTQEGEGEGFQAALERYIAHREAIGSPLTSPGLDMLLKRLEELAQENEPDKAAILEQSIRNGWKDVYGLGQTKSKSIQSQAPNSFHNFEQSKVDYDALVIERIREKMAQ